MTVEFEAPAFGAPYRVLILGAATEGWYQADDETRRNHVLPRFSSLMEEWQALGARVLATLDDDLFMTGSPSAVHFAWYFILELDSLDVLAAMTQRVRDEVDGVRMDRYVRFQARIGRPFFLLEPERRVADSSRSEDL
jgi:hypothetical protein